MIPIFLIVAVFIIAFLAIFIFSKFFAKERLALADDWKLVGKKWSTWLVAIGGLLEGFLDAFPSAMLYVWNMMPEDLKGTLPPNFGHYIAIGIILFAVPAKMIKQRQLTKPAEVVEKTVIVNDAPHNR